MMQTYGKLIFLPPDHCPIIFHTMSPLFSQMSPLFQVPWDIVPSYEISRQNTDNIGANDLPTTPWQTFICINVNMHLVDLPVLKWLNVDI